MSCPARESSTISRWRGRNDENPKVSLSAFARESTAGSDIAPPSLVDKRERVQRYNGDGYLRGAFYQVTLTLTPMAPFPGSHGLTRESPDARDFIVSSEPELWLLTSGGGSNINLCEPCAFVEGGVVKSTEVAARFESDAQHPTPLGADE